MPPEPGRPLLVRATAALEGFGALDRVVARVEPFASWLVATPARRWLLHGRALGHAVHPVLTDVPLGAWMSASILDLAPGTDASRAARRLVGTGVLAALPTAVTGWAEWAVAGQQARRVGVVHATANSVALALYTGSWFARRAGRSTSGTLLALAGGAASGVGGYLGGHLAVARSTGTRDPAFEAAGSEPALDGSARPGDPGR